MSRLHRFAILLSVFVVDAIAQDERPLVVCATQKSVLMVDTQTHAFTEIVTHLNRSVAVDYHYGRDLLVWTDVDTEKIYSAHIAGGTGNEKKVLVEVCVTPDGVAVDWIHDNLYWTDADKDVIGVARLLDGSLHKTLLDKELHEPRAIVIHPEMGLMFWTDWGTVAKIERAGMDGSERTAIVTSEIRWPNGLAIDLPSQRIYWIDGSTKILSSSNYDGKDKRVIITSLNTPLKHPFSLDILGDWLYWSEWASGRKGLYVVNKNTNHRDLSKILGGKDWDTLMGLKVYDRSKQPPGINRCVNNGGCTHLCLPAPGVLTYSCACPDGVFPSDNCSTVPLEPLLNSSNERRNQDEPNAKSSIPAGAIVGIALGIAALVTVAFYVHRLFSKRIGQAAMTSQGWAGIDNPVYRDTTQHQVCFQKAPTDGDPHTPAQEPSRWLN